MTDSIEIPAADLCIWSRRAR